MNYLTGYRPFSRRAVLAGLLAGSASWAWASRAYAYDVVISPANPQLGDTLSVIIQASQPGAAPPVVTLNHSTRYPVFPLSGNRFRALIPTSPLTPPGTLTIQVMGDEGNRNLAVGLRNRSFPTQRITLRPGQASLGTPHEFERVAAFRDLVTPERFWNGAMVRPNPGRVTTVYGVRRYYNGVFAQDYYHRGVDYAAPTGSPVVSPAAGRIALVGRVSEGFELHGNTVGIDHGQGVLSIMIHLHRIDVNEGDFVQAGQGIGTVGSTGISTGPHLHWGLYVNGISVDPVPWRERGFE
ncbi:peptidase [Leptolyngbya sp. BL0902]|uniref:M23 family metallopeptidase n=1 Tax=Leptolyngbya sp. BL0902 TaxID=1115757 RepID=UPI0018E82F47|nr:M23 family metallopeptidase [Leptolyngbya sp. BL0902]QQE65668.1 peptidase [Leptolyngbya sp. BL0902]